MLVQVYSETPIKGARMRPATSSRISVQQLETKTTRYAIGRDIGGEVYRSSALNRLLSAQRPRAADRYSRHSITAPTAAAAPVTNRTMPSHSGRRLRAPTASTASAASAT